MTRAAEVEIGHSASVRLRRGDQHASPVTSFHSDAIGPWFFWQHI